jgi:hypothetical protein
MKFEGINGAYLQLNIRGDESPYAKKDTWVINWLSVFIHIRLPNGTEGNSLDHKLLTWEITDLISWLETIISDKRFSRWQCYEEVIGFSYKGETNGMAVLGIDFMLGSKKLTMITPPDKKIDWYGNFDMILPWPQIEASINELKEEYVHYPFRAPKTKS